MEDLRKRLLEGAVPEDRVRSQIKRPRFQLEAYRMEQEGCVSARERRQEESPAEIAARDVDLEELDLTERGKKRTLHVIGGCYCEFVVVGNVRPQPPSGRRREALRSFLQLQGESCGGVRS